MLFPFSHRQAIEITAQSAQGLADVLEAKQAEGVAIRGLVDPGFGYRSYSELLDLLGKQLPDHR